MERGKITLLWKIKEKFLLILRKIVHKRTVMLKNGKKYSKMIKMG